MMFRVICNESLQKLSTTSHFGTSGNRFIANDWTFGERRVSTAQSETRWGLQEYLKIQWTIAESGIIGKWAAAVRSPLNSTQWTVVITTDLRVLDHYIYDTFCVNRRRQHQLVLFLSSGAWLRMTVLLNRASTLPTFRQRHAIIVISDSDGEFPLS